MLVSSYGIVLLCFYTAACVTWYGMFDFAKALFSTAQCCLCGNLCFASPLYRYVRYTTVTKPSVTVATIMPLRSRVANTIVGRIRMQSSNLQTRCNNGCVHYMTPVNDLYRPRHYNNDTTSCAQTVQDGGWQHVTWTANISWRMKFCVNLMLRYTGSQTLSKTSETGEWHCSRPFSYRYNFCLILIHYACVLPKDLLLPITRNSNHSSK